MNSKNDLKSDQIGWKLWNVKNSNIVYTMYEFFCCDNLFAVKSFVFSMSTLIDSCEQFFYCEKIPWDDWSEITPQKCKKETDRQTYREDVMKQKIPGRNLIRHQETLISKVLKYFLLYLNIDLLFLDNLFFH